MGFAGRLVTSLFAITLFLTLVASSSRTAPIAISRQPPRSSIAARSRAFILECSASSATPPHSSTPSPVTWSWLKDGVDVASPHARLKGDTLNFNPFVYNKTYRDDVGFYQCVAQNSYGSVMSRATLVQVATLSKFTDPASQSVHVGDMARFYGIAAAAIPSPSYTWNDEASVSLSTGSKGGRVYILPNGALHLTDAQLSDSGSSFQLLLQNDRGTKLFAPAKLTVTQRSGGRGACAAKFLNFPSKVIASVGETAVIEVVIEDLSCHATQPFAGWSKNSQKIDLSSSSSRHQLIIYSLAIGNVEFGDAGVYEIEVAFNNTFSISNKTELIIEGPPVVETYPAVQDMPNRGMAQLNCTASGWPQPTLQWFFNSKPLNHPNTRLLHNGTRLEMKNFTEADKGVYQCSAQNSKGMDIATTYLTADADGPPGPVGNISLQFLLNQKIVVSWSKPSFPNGVIIDYTVFFNFAIGSSLQVKTTENNFFIYSSLENSTNFSAQLPIDSIKYGATYGVVIIARTSGGLGDSSDLVTYHVKRRAPDGPPLGVSAELTETRLQVSWNPPNESLQYGPIVRYQIRYVDAEGVEKRVNVGGKARTVQVQASTSEVGVSIAAATNTSEGDILWGPYSEEIRAVVSVPPTVTATSGQTVRILTSSGRTSNATESPVAVTDDLLQIIIYVIPAAIAFLLFIIIIPICCCCCREEDNSKVSITPVESKSIESLPKEQVHRPSSTNPYEDVATSSSMPMRSFNPSTSLLLSAAKERSKTRPAETVSDAPLSPLESSATVHADQPVSPPPYKEQNGKNSGRPPPPPVAPKPSGRVRGKRRRKHPELHIPPAPGSAPINNDDDDDGAMETSRLMQSPRRQMSLREQTQLKLMMDELASSPTTQKPGIGEPTQGERPESMEAMLNSGPEASESPPPPPPPPPPPAVDYLEEDNEEAEFPPRPPPPTDFDESLSEEEQKLEAEDVLDDLMKQLELETENLGDLLEESGAWT